MTPAAAAPLTEEKIERHVESAMNALDRRLMQHSSPLHLSQAEYDSEVERLNRWANAQYAKVRR